MTKKIPHGDVLKHSLESMYVRLTELVDTIPEGCALDENEDHAYTAYNVWSIEEEWILDPQLRDELSVLQVDD